MVTLTDPKSVSGGSDAPGTEEGRELRRLKVESADAGFMLNLDAIALDYRTLHVASVAGPATHIKALAAILHTDVRVAFRYYGSSSTAQDLCKASDGYRVWKTRPGYNCWHAVAVSKTAGILPNISEEAIWRELRSERFTTPILRSWLPYILQELRANDKLHQLESWGCQVGWLTAGSKDLDEIVSQGLKKNKITIE